MLALARAACGRPGISTNRGCSRRPLRARVQPKRAPIVLHVHYITAWHYASALCASGRRAASDLVCWPAGHGLDPGARATCSVGPEPATATASLALLRGRAGGLALGLLPRL